MAIQKKSDQQLYLGKGPLDAKSIVKTYTELFSSSTWVKDDTLVAYNGMLVAVYLDKENGVLTSRNGVYYLFDPAATTALKKPDYSNESNWHKISDTIDLSGIEESLNRIDTSIEELDSRIDELEVEYVRIEGGSASK